MSITWINLIFLIIMLLAMYITYQNRILAAQKTDEFVLLVDEAKSVKDDLEQLLDQVLNVSGNIIDNFNSISEQHSWDRVSNERQLLKEISHALILDKEAAAPVPTLDNAAAVIEDDKADGILDNNNVSDHTAEPILTPQLDQARNTQSFDLQKFHSVVNNLYKKGFTTKEIAQKLDKGQDEVNLIINLLDMQYINT